MGGYYNWFPFPGTQTVFLSNKSFIDNICIIAMMSKLGGIQCTSWKEDRPLLWWAQCLRKPTERMWEMDGESDREGRQRRRAVGHGAKQPERGIPTDVRIYKLARCLIATSPCATVLKRQLAFRKRSQIVRFCQWDGDLSYSTNQVITKCVWVQICTDKKSVFQKS